MYCFCFGTFSGLFVEGSPPAKLPEDLSFFDLRRKRKRAIPQDNSINLIFRHCSEKHFFVACARSARDGKRDGFLGYGVSLVEPISIKDIEEAIDWCYQTLLESNFIDSGKIIKSPVKSNGPMVDLSELDTPADFEKFALVNYDWQNVAKKKDIAYEIVPTLLEKMASFEIIFNVHTGDEISSLEKLFPNAISERIAESRSRLQKANHALQTIQARTPQGASFYVNTNLMSKISAKLPIIIGALGILCLTIVLGIAVKVWFFPTEASNQDIIVQKNILPIDEILPATDTSETKQPQCGVGLEEKREEGEAPYFIVDPDAIATKKLWDPKPNGKCNELDDAVINWFENEGESRGLKLDPVPHRGQKDKRYLEKIDDDIYFTSFKSLVDWWHWHTTNKKAKPFALSKPKTEEGFMTEFSFAISKPLDDLESSQKQLICDKKFIEGLNDANHSIDKSEMLYYSSSDSLFDRIVGKNADAFRTYLAGAIVDYSENVKGQARRESLRKLKDRYIYAPIVEKYEIGQPIENKCIYTSSRLDQELLKSRTMEELITLGPVEFLSKLSGTPESDYPSVSCRTLPDQIMIWKRRDDGKTNLHMPVDLNFVNIFIGIPSAASSDEVGPSWSFPPLDNKEDKEDKRLVKQLKRHLQSDGRPLFNTFDENSPACKKI